MRSRLTRIPKATLIAASAVVAFATPALAVTSGSFPTMTASGVKFTSGQWSFSNWPSDSTCYKGKWPGFSYSGNLTDTSSDGDWVYTRGKIDASDWSGGSSAENHSGKNHPAYISQIVYQSEPPTKGKIQVCTHRGGLTPNDCAESPWKYR